MRSRPGAAWASQGGGDGGRSEEVLNDVVQKWSATCVCSTEFSRPLLRSPLHQQATRGALRITCSSLHPSRLQRRLTDSSK